jgi:F-type H+-transporting ATPase subunit epsilon
MVEQGGTATDKLVRCVVVTPEAAVVDEQADFVALPMYDGELGVLHGRAPLIGRLGYGELRLRRGNTVHRYFVDGGFAQVRDNVVTVLTARAFKPEEIKVDEVRRQLQATTHGAATTPEAQEANEKNAARARAQLRVARAPQGGGSPHA